MPIIRIWNTIRAPPSRSLDLRFSKRIGKCENKITATVGGFFLGKTNPLYQFTSLMVAKLLKGDITPDRAE
ncbi:hypothetical protein HMPREF9997_00631 [Corynebacterium durum F0235]|uniref:Uncharacterized protein n=1 Tax=Corynebacterium durum F0235 TaxID=1035195 RepID=L1MKU4_9CORY|nr:hypothetical protein HMPREF9997_00631 [Corynebacterium durum F0235]